ncbi:MAG: hypothetical protein NTV97_31280 [Alphaproteobacteria bacterium]|nr:hypothetical protein [Alphaproteobacteria bacterium]
MPAGRYATCLAEGFLRLGRTVVYSLTVDFHGDADTVNGRGYPSTRAAIARRVATGRGTIRLSESQIDSVSFNAFDTEYTAACGWYWRDAVSKADALNDIMAGCLGWWVMRLSGVLAIGALGKPTGTPALVLNFPEDFAGEPKMMDTYMAPRRASYVGWARNYTPQDPSQLAASVDQAQALIWAAQQRLALASDDFQANVWPTSAVVATAGNFALESAALAEARRQQSVMGVRRERWTVPVPCDPFSDLLGRVVQINNYNRFGWGMARKFICVGMSFASGRTVNLELWG